MFPADPSFPSDPQFPIGPAVPSTGLPEPRFPAQPIPHGAHIAHAMLLLDVKKLIPITLSDVTVTADPPQSAPTFSSGTENNVALADGSWVYVQASGAATWTGIAAKALGTTQFVVVTGTETITVQHDNAGSSAANRVLIHGDADRTYAPNEGFLLTYGPDSRWHIPFGA